MKEISFWFFVYKSELVLDRVQTTSEDFENGGLTLKTDQMYFYNNSTSSCALIG